MLAADRLSAAKLRAGLGHCTIGKEIIVLDETTSTNDVVLQMANDGAREGLVVFAEHQTAGRGQRGNVWESAAGKGLSVSIQITPEIELQDSARLTTWAAQTVASVINSTFHLVATVKLPNDVYIGDRKVAGVLVEIRAQPGRAHIG